MSLAELETTTRDSGSANKAWLRALNMTSGIAKQPARTLPAVIDELAETFGDAPALMSEGESLTYRGLAARANQYARWALAQGIAKGDVVCLLMPNRPEYLAIWLGITRIGGIVSLLNTNLTGPSLAHCINVAAPAHIIVAVELRDAFAGAQPHLTAAVEIWMHGAGDDDHQHIGYRRIDREVERYAAEKLAPAELASVTIADRALLVYTSGTTGLPKAANISHERLMRWSYWFAGMMGTRASDRMYDCLPMYHSVGGVVAIGALLVVGGSVVIREKFSAREFWRDIARWDCTVFQYIGELCRYLVNADGDPSECAHRIRLASGNGLRNDVWEEFQRRFRIPKILEFYAATEGSFSLYNAEGRAGAIGRIPSYLAHRFPAALVQFDVERGEPTRDGRGFCRRCAPNEVGEAIGRIIEGNAGQGNRFEGYTSKAESEKKILRDVFEAGDAWFRTGDLMRRDEAGYFYFVDRVGDTFRWKGENVATSEVAEAIMDFPGVLQATVYGVAVPGTDGRAGMAALAVDHGFDVAMLYRHLEKRLPAYARPVFLRVTPELAVTATFKHQKSELMRTGYDPRGSDDAIYVADAARAAFAPLDAMGHERVQSGAMRL